jgi:hypothetical protein
MSGLAPAYFTMDDVAEAVSRSTGTEAKYRNVTPEELKADLVAKGGIFPIREIPHREQKESKKMPVLSHLPPAEAGSVPAPAGRSQGCSAG